MFLSCGEKTTTQVIDFSNINKVTGIDLFDINGEAIGRWREPNHNPGDSRAFPVPGDGNLFIFSQSNIQRVMVIPADCIMDETENIVALSQELAYDIEDIEEFVVLDVPTPNFNMNLALDLTNLEAGFYKVFFIINADENYWQNIYIDPGVTSFPDIDFLDVLCI